MMPSGVSVPAIAPPTAPTRPSPLITTGTSLASTARRARSTPSSSPRVRSTRKGIRRSSSSCSITGSSFRVRPCAEAGLTSKVNGMPSISIRVAA